MMDCGYFFVDGGGELKHIPPKYPPPSDNDELPEPPELDPYSDPCPEDDEGNPLPM